MKRIILAAVSALALTAALPAHAAISAVAYDATGHSVIDFEDQPAAAFPASSTTAC